MCGIAGCYLLDSTLKVDLDAMLTTMLESIEHRGGDATGYVAVGPEGVNEWQKAACGAGDFNRHRRPVPKGTRTILAHTRWATQGLPAFVENNHPLRRGSFYAIHNGHVSNDYELFQLASRERYGQVDSEAIPARLASLGKLGGLSKVMTEIDGAAAVAAVDESKPNELAVARGFSSPLYVLRTKRIMLFGSTYETVKLAYTKHVGKLGKAKVEQVKQGTLLHVIDGKVKRSSFTPYSPPAPKEQKWMDKVTLPWKETSTEATPKSLPSLSSHWDEDSEWIECDSCQAKTNWLDLKYEYDSTTNSTWQVCEYCLEDDTPVVPMDDYVGANAAILSEDGEDS